MVTFADRPDLADELYALARVAYADQPGRAGSRKEIVLRGPLAP